MTPSDDSLTLDLNGQPSADLTATFGGPAAPAAAGSLATAAGRYRLVAHHRTGGLGQVWRAEDTVVRRTVALKCLRPDRSAAAFAPRFVHEARVTGQLEHPNIVPLYDLFESADGPAYAMRFLDGETLAEAARGYHDRRAKGAVDPLELPRLLDAFGLVCRAVEFAHERGVLHRDLKGQNILIGKYGEVCLADWGLAKWVGEPDRPGDPSPLSPSLEAATEPGAVMGTPAFMAPELVRQQPASVATDVYGLGAVLYQLLTAAVPHTGTTPQEVLSKLESGEPVRPARERNPSLHPALDAVCRKALSYDPAARYPSAAALADDVRAYLAGEPVGAYPEPFLARAGRWVRRHKAGVLAGVVALAVAAVGASVAAVLVWQEKERTEAEKRKVEEARAEEEKARVEAETQRDKYQAMLSVVRDYSDRVTEFVTETETGGTATRPSSADRKTSLAGAVVAAEQLVKAQPDDPELRTRLARLLRYTANLARVRNDRPTAEKAFAAALQLTRAQVADRPDDPDPVLWLASALRGRAVYQSNFGQLKEAAAGLDEASALLTALPEATRDRSAVRREVALNWTFRAEVDTRFGRLPQAANAADRAVGLFAGLADSPPAGRHWLDPALGGLARSAQAVALRESARAAGGSYAPALAAHADAVAGLRLAAEADERPDVRTLYHLAVLEQVRTRRLANDPPSALMPSLDRAVDGWRFLNRNDPGVASYRQFLAQALTQRAELRATLPDAVARSLAAVDLADAQRLTDRLRAAAPDRPDYWADAATGLAAEAKLMTVPHEYAGRLQRAYQFAQQAARQATDDVVVRRLKQAIMEDGKRAGLDVTAKAAKSGR